MIFIDKISIFKVKHIFILIISIWIELRDIANEIIFWQLLKNTVLTRITRITI